MGRHVDHRGGCVNVMAIDREILVGSAARTDDRLLLKNLDTATFAPCEISLDELRARAGEYEWQALLDLGLPALVPEAPRGDWSHYVRAVVLALERRTDRMRLPGLDLLVTSDLPIGAGLSSSSALTMALAEVLMAHLELDLSAAELVDVAGEGERLVGVRGGLGDHAAIKLSRPGFVSQVGFFPTGVRRQVRLPDGLEVVVAHSGQSAIKSLGARDSFNQRVACADLALMLLRYRWPSARGVEHLRDLTEEQLALSAKAIYAGLELLPEQPSRAEILALLPEAQHRRVERVLATHADPGSYDLRGVTLYALGECARSALFPELLVDGDLERVGRWMRISHDGDRLHESPAMDPGSDCDLGRLRRERVPLRRQSGRYACSTEAIDQLVDIATATPGVIGAQLLAAGLGGCIMALVHEQSVTELLDRFQTQFYQPRGLEPAAFAVAPMAGSGILGAPSQRDSS